MYADDHQLFEISDNVTTINDQLNASATKASLWYESNLLKGNFSKYHTMLINNKQRDRRDDINVNVRGTDVDCLNSIKLLGVAIDNKLNFSEHINITCKKANHRILMRLKNYTFLRLQFSRTSPTAILPGISDEQVTRENLNAPRRGVCVLSSEIVKLHMSNYRSKLI